MKWSANKPQIFYEGWAQNVDSYNEWIFDGIEGKVEKETLESIV